MPNLQSAYLKWHAIWHKRQLTIVFGMIYLLLSLFAMVHFLNASYLGDRYFKTTFDGMYEGTTFKPFVYRQLVPSMARAITAISPDILKSAVNDSVQHVRGDAEYATWRVTMPWLERAFVTPGKHYPRVVAILIIYGFLWGYIWALQALTREIFPGQTAMAYITPIFGVLLISSFSFPFQYLYDIPDLFFATACFYYLACRRWIPYLAMFFLGCINKETIGFVFLFSAIWLYPRLERRSYINLMLMQYLVFAIVRVVLLYLYNDNTGEYLKNHLFRVIPDDLLVTSRYARIFSIAWMFFLLTFQWDKKPDFLKCGLWLLPPMYLAYLLYGMPGEYRVFFDVLPLPLLLCVHTLVEGTGVANASFFKINQDRNAP